MTSSEYVHKDKTEQLMYLSLSVSQAAARVAKGRTHLNLQEKRSLMRMELLMRQEAELLTDPETTLKIMPLPVGYILDIAGVEKPDTTRPTDAAALLGAFATELAEIAESPAENRAQARKVAEQYRDLYSHTKSTLTGTGENLPPNDAKQNQLDL